MRSRGELRIDPISIGAGGGAEELEIVVLHLDAAVTPAVLKRAGELTAGLNARILLLAVQTVPFPASYASAAASHAHRWRSWWMWRMRPRYQCRLTSCWRAGWRRGFATC
jgi:hypothetical protein